jgi:hypothetical protein
MSEDIDEAMVEAAAAIWSLAASEQKSIPKAMLMAGLCQ